MPRIPRGLVLRFCLFAVILGASVLALRVPALREQFELETLAATIEALGKHPLAIPGYVVTTAVLTAVGCPASPLVLSAGAVFGTLLGGTLAYLGTFLGALLSFLLAHTLARDLVVHLLGKRLQAMERLLEQHGFWTLFRMRYLPLPFALTNYAASLAGLRLSVYTLSTALGLLPVTFIYTYLASSLTKVAQAELSGVLRNLFMATALVLLLSFLPPRLIARWQRKEQRRGRAQPRPPEDRS